MSSRISFLVGNGFCVKFWKDKLCGDTPLSVYSPSLFALIDLKEAWVEDVWNSLVEVGRGGWNPCFSRPCNDWRVDCVKSFLARLHGKRVLGMWKIGCFGQRQKVASLLLSPSIMP